MAKQRPHTIILTELVQRSLGTTETEIAVPVSTIRKLVTETVTLWGGPEGKTPRQATVTLVQRTTKDVFMVKQSVRSITKMLNGDVEIESLQG